MSGKQLDSAFAALLGHLRGAHGVNAPDGRDENASPAVLSYLLDELTGPLADELTALVDLCETIPLSKRHLLAARCSALTQHLQDSATALYPYLPAAPAPSREELNHMQSSLKPWVRAEEVIALAEPRKVLASCVRDLSPAARIISPTPQRPQGLCPAALLRSIAGELRDLPRLLAAANAKLPNR
jgi:hypothetical protein